MALFENFPYTNLHELNLDWLIQELKQMQDQTVLSVNGQTGEVVLYTQATVQFPEVSEDHWSIIRLSDGTTRGILFGNDDKAYIVHGSLMAEVYAQNNPPPYPVTSVNGQTGAVTIFSDQYVQLAPLTDTSMHSWSLFRKLSGKNVGIDFDDQGNTFIIDGLSRYQVLTTADIPTGSGVFTVNGLEGVVILTANDIEMASNDTRTIKQAIDSIINDEYMMDNSITYTERGATASQNIPLGRYVIWQNRPYISISNIAIGDTLSTSNLSALNHGIADNLLNSVNSNTNQINAINNNFVNLHWSATTPLTLSNCSVYQGIGVRYSIVGNICHLYINVQGLTANSRVKIAVLPSNACPLMSYPIMGSGGLSYTSKSYFTISSDGSIFVLSDDQYATLYTNFVVS